MSTIAPYDVGEQYLAGPTATAGPAAETREAAARAAAAAGAAAALLVRRRRPARAPEPGPRYTR
jgi:hypothetical protein